MTSSQKLETIARPTTTTWTLDAAHSRAEFAVRHLMIANVRGTIPIQSARIVRDEDDVTRSSVEAVLDVAGVDTKAADRDGHLRSPDFFDVANHPTMTFASREVEETEDGLRVHGDLTIRGATRPVVLDVELLGEAKDPWGNAKAAATATTAFDRRDFGLTWNAALETGGFLVSDTVKVSLEISAIKQA